MYTNTDGVIPISLELQDYIKEKSPKSVCLTEAKPITSLYFVFGNNYNVWRMDSRSKSGGGVTIMVRKRVNSEGNNTWSRDGRNTKCKLGEQKEKKWI